MEPAEKQRAIEAIQAAIDAWSSCNWTHELRDAGGEIVYGDGGEPRYCDGGHEDCLYCTAAEKDAKRAQSLGRLAIAAMTDGARVIALDCVEAAARLERYWGAEPIWGPVAILLHEED